MSSNPKPEEKFKFRSRAQQQFKNCIPILLEAMNWKGADRDYVEALPHFCQSLNIYLLIDVFKKLKFNCTTIKKLSFENIDERVLPCLAVDNITKRPYVIIGKEDGQYKIFDGYEDRHIKLKMPIDLVTLYVFRAMTKNDRENQKRRKTTWLRETLNTHRPLIIQAGILSFFYNLLLLTVPLYIMSVYDRVIGVGSYEMLFDFTFGVCLVIAGIGFIHFLRSRVLSYIGAQVDRDVGTAIFAKLMYLSPQYTESASVESQISRIKDFDLIREFFTGNLFTTCLDLPFVSLYLIAILALVGGLAVIPISLIGIFIVIALLNNRKLKELNVLSSYHSSNRQEFLLEALDSVRTIKQNSVLDTWENRQRELSAHSAYHASRVTFTVNANNSVSDFLMLLAGISVMSFGVFGVFDGSITPGALVAAMILVWRALTPIRQFFVGLPRLQQIANSIQSLDRLIAIQEEVDPSITSKKIDLKFKGHLRFEQVSFRYPGAITPALLNLNIDVQPGQIMMITGNNGSGKSSLLQLINNMYQPQAGNVLVDGCDIRQISPIQLRHAIAYCPQTPDLFYGTIAQNIRMADPTASDKRIFLACELAGIADQIKKLDHGIHTPVRDQSSSQLSTAFIKAVCLARTYIKNSKIFLLDEPANGLDNQGDKFLIEALNRMRGKKTVIMVTHRPSHLKLADKIIVLKSGQISAQGTPDEIMPSLDKVHI